jgi:hypothetical protein
LKKIKEVNSVRDLLYGSGIYFEKLLLKKEIIFEDY